MCPLGLSGETRTRGILVPNAGVKLFAALNRWFGTVCSANGYYLTRFAPLNSLSSDGVYGRLCGQNPAFLSNWEAGFS